MKQACRRRASLCMENVNFKLECWTVLEIENNKHKANKRTNEQSNDYKKNGRKNKQDDSIERAKKTNMHTCMYRQTSMSFQPHLEISMHNMSFMTIFNR